METRECVGELGDGLGELKGFGIEIRGLRPARVEALEGWRAIGFWPCESADCGLRMKSVRYELGWMMGSEIMLEKPELPPPLFLPLLEFRAAFSRLLGGILFRCRRQMKRIAVMMSRAANEPTTAPMMTEVSGPELPEFEPASLSSLVAVAEDDCVPVAVAEDAGLEVGEEEGLGLGR